MDFLFVNGILPICLLFASKKKNKLVEIPLESGEEGWRKDGGKKAITKGMDWGGEGETGGSGPFHGIGVE
jgi:hypothetical protein